MEECPCKSKQSYETCCKPFHKGDSKPETCEQLMRSRYTAYYKSLVEYLVKTTHPSKLKPNYKDQLERTKNDTNWVGLEVLKTTLGTDTDKIGKVHFIAHYIQNGQQAHMEEYSRFRRYKGNWVYYDDKG